MNSNARLGIDTFESSVTRNDVSFSACQKNVPLYWWFDACSRSCLLQVHPILIGLLEMFYNCSYMRKCRVQTINVRLLNEFSRGIYRADK